MKRRVDVLQEFREVNEGLTELLAGLSPSDWAMPTVHPDRNVKDLAAHLLDGSLRRLAVQRDGFQGEGFEGSSFDELVAFIQRLNREWIVAARRLSPAMILSMVEEADRELLALFEKLEPEAPALYSVAWAGETESANWFDVAREYTEKWHHQQQIRDAVGQPGLDSRRHMLPVLETFVRAIPHAYRAVDAPDGTAIQVSITGDSAMPVCLKRDEGRWILRAAIVHPASAELVLDGGTAWRLWTKCLRASDVASDIGIYGDAALVAPLLRMCCIMA